MQQRGRRTGSISCGRRGADFGEFMQSSCRLFSFDVGVSASPHIVRTRTSSIDLTDPKAETSCRLDTSHSPRTASGCSLGWSGSMVVDS
jgi:hypothetical protein